MSTNGSARARTAMSASSSSSHRSVLDYGVSRPSTSFKSVEKHSSASPSRQSVFRSGNRNVFTDLLGGSSRVTSSYVPPQKTTPKGPTGGRMLFTGPDQSDSHRIQVGDKGKYVGFRPLSKEVTSDSEYLYRPCKGDEPAMRMRHERVGEIGWNVPKLWRLSKLEKSLAS
ncbi:uncharacterized protein LOC120340339 [Styela clava]